MDYKTAGVDTDAHKEALSRVKEKIRASFGENVVGDVGHFGGLYRLDDDGDRVLVATTDGLGTKVKMLAELGRHSSVGRDLVNHCVNDVSVLGARPLFFLDYIAGAGLVPEILAPLVEGFADACLGERIAMIGGETAEMPGVYRDGTYDVAGFLVGEVERSKMIDGSAIRPGDEILGFPSNGLHTNGYSLATKALFEQGGLTLSSEAPNAPGRTVGDLLAETHLSYRSQISALLAGGDVRGLAHITGGGIAENLERILPEGCAARIRGGGWAIPPVFRLIEERGGIASDEMDRVFNMGIGLVAVVRAGSGPGVRELLPGSGVVPIGEVEQGPRGVTIERG